jgi:hypothetical protein
MNAEAAAELDRQLVAIMVSAGRACTAEQATAIRVKILGRKRVNDPAAYVASVVRRDPAAAFALLTAPPPSPNGQHRQPPPSAEVLAVRATVNPEVAKRGAALARKLLDGRPAAGKVPPAPEPEEFPF